ncbi:MAG: tetratricopeptide repeat protein [Betaproteobacteria bacterium]|nr:MAG: tetratricopeptide repeat protein [Betaproteobacteria bacterium]
MEQRMEWEQRLADLWASIDQLSEQAFLSKMEFLVAELPPDSAVAAFERAGSFDSTGHSDLAVPLYRNQMASSFHNLGQASESVPLLMAERERQSDDLDDAVSAALALALVDVGREREAVSIAVTALSRQMTRCRRSMANYARLISDRPSS